MSRGLVLHYLKTTTTLLPSTSLWGFIHKHSSFITNAHPFMRLYMFFIIFLKCTACTISLPLGHRNIFANAKNSHGVGDGV